MANLHAALAALERDGIRIRARSDVYETEPQAGAVGQADFLNACIELELGRNPAAPRHAPRPLDIDILIVEGQRIDTADYHVPHTEIEQRRFVLVPLLELDPPGRDDLERALSGLEGQRVVHFGAL
jgi:7,8-dihydro-6-hydroxymethylpterin-pyrophosphokinase